MNSNLSTLLAKTLSHASTSNTLPSQSSGPSTGTNMAMYNTAAPAVMVKAVEVNNTTKAVISRLPNHVLSISIPGDQANRTMQFTAPTSVGQSLGQQVQLAVMPPTTNITTNTTHNTRTNNSGSMVVISSSTTQHSIALSPDQRADLIKAIAQVTSLDDGVVSFKAKLKTLANGELVLRTAQNTAIQLDTSSATKAALQSFIGQNMTVALSKNVNGIMSVTLSPASASTTKDSVTINNLSTGAQRGFIESAIKQGGVAININPQILPLLTPFLPSEITNSNNVLKAIVVLNLTEQANHKNTLTINSAQSRAVLALPSQHQTSLPALSRDQAASVSLTTLPKGQMLDVGNASQSQQTGVILNEVHSLTSQSAKNIQGSEVHKAISSLARVLLSQTGNTHQALAQLITLLENKGTLKEPSGNTESPERFALSKLVHQVKALDVLNTSGSQVTDTKKVKVGHVQSPSTHGDIRQTNKHPEETNSSDYTRQSPHKKTTFSALATALSSPAKVLSAGVIQQLLAKTTTPDGINKPNAIEAEIGISGGDVVANTGEFTRKVVSENTEQGLSHRIQHILSSSALIATPSTLTSTVTSSNFVQGLVALVQLALAGRAMQRQPSLKALIDAPDSFIAKTLSNLGASAQPSRVSHELSQLDDKRQLITQLKTLLANHQQSKVASAESRIQGQDSFYYVLPSPVNSATPPELLIKREQGGARDNKQRAAAHSLWNITMKLDLGDCGQLLAKSKIETDTISLDLYASNDVVLQRIADTLPYLTRRLSSLGLTITSSSYQRGHIPDSLNARPHHIFETRV